MFCGSRIESFGANISIQVVFFFLGKNVLESKQFRLNDVHFGIPFLF